MMLIEFNFWKFFLLRNLSQLVMLNICEFSELSHMENKILTMCGKVRDSSLASCHENIDFDLENLMYYQCPDFADH